MSPRIFVEIKGECECEKVHPNQYLASLKCLIKAKVFSLWLCVSRRVLVINPGWCIQGESSQTPLLCTISILTASSSSVSFLTETGWRCPILGSAAASGLSFQALLSVEARGSQLLSGFPPPSPTHFFHIWSQPPGPLASFI